MNDKKDSRLTFDVPVEMHKQLKATAAILGKSMRDVVIESLQAHLHSLSSSGINKDTIKKIGM